MIHILVSNEKTIFTDAPIFRISNPVSVHGRIGEKVKLECSVDSFSIPTFRWVSQTGYEIFENIDTFNKMSRLTVKSSNSVPPNVLNVLIFSDRAEISRRFEKNLQMLCYK